MGAEEAFKRIDLASLRGTVEHPDEQILEYFVHFTVLMHLELLAEVANIRRRLANTPLERLVGAGWALSSLPVRSTFGRRDYGGVSKRALPGWQDNGHEMVAFSLPQMFDAERCRLTKGDCVTLSGSDPLKDKVAEGLVTDVRPGAMVVQLNGKMPDQQGRTWRLDKTANRVVYERQLGALLQLTSVEN